MPTKASFQIKVNLKAVLQVQSLLLLAEQGERWRKVGSFPSLKSPNMGGWLPEWIKIPVYHFREKMEAIFDREGDLIWAFWLLLSISHLLSSVISFLSFLPSLLSSVGIDTLTDGPWTSGPGTGEGGAEKTGIWGWEGWNWRERGQETGNNNSDCQIQRVSPCGWGRDVWFRE